jgi:hypothetical protein
MMLAGLVKNECRKAFRMRKPRLFMAAATLLQLIAVFRLLRDGAGEMNGQSFPLHMIDGQPLLMALYAAAIAADLAADEYRSGALKLALLRPVGRGRLVLAKAAALALAVAALAVFQVVAAYAVGTLAFGWGDRLLADGVPVTGDGVAATLKAAAAQLAPCMGFGMLALFLALVTGHAGMTIGLSAALYLFLPLTRMDPRYSIVHQMNGFHLAVLHGAPIRDVLADLGVAAAYAVLFLAAGAFYMKRKDVLL